MKIHTAGRVITAVDLIYLKTLTKINARAEEARWNFNKNKYN